MTHKAGYVNIIGRPNVGKSTLMNQLVGEKISIITSKAQTTRHRILGIVNGDDFQIVFSDTPGIIKDPAYKMHEVMNQFVNVALIDADLILFVVDITDKKIEEKTVERLKTTDIPVFVLINKIDLSTQEAVEQAVEQWRETLPNATVFPLSAQYNANVEFIFKQILEKLPECPPYFPKDELTDRSMRFFITEIIRAIPCKSKWRAMRRANTASTSAASSMWPATRKRPLSSARAAVPSRISACRPVLTLRSLQAKRYSWNSSSKWIKTGAIMKPN